MNDKKKLIERLRDIASLTPPICQYDRPIELDVMGKKITAYCKPFEQFQDLLREAADALANGVVVREKGEWENVGKNRGYVCSNCGSRCLLNYESDWHESKFCPHCGADMRKGERMKTKIIPCPVCDGKGYTLWANTTDQSCSTGSKTCPHCNGMGVREVAKTNADRIRAMSDEELAKWMSGGALKSDSACSYCKRNIMAFCDGSECSTKTDAEIILDWLKQPVKDGEGE